MGISYFTRYGTGKCFCRKSTLASYLNLTLYQVRRGLVELEEKDFINIKRVGQGNPDIITLKGTLKDLKSRNEKPKTPIHYREEELVKEELEDFKEELSIPNINNITPKDDNPPPDSHQVATPDGISTPNTDNVDEVTPQSPQTITDTPKQGYFDCCDDLKTKPNPLYQRATETLRNEIKPQISYNSFLHFFKTIKVVAETEDTVSLTTPHGNHIANLIQEQYSTKLEKITNKRVEVTS